MRENLIKEMSSIDIENGTEYDCLRHAYLAKKLYIYDRLSHLLTIERISVVNSFRQGDDVFKFLKNHKIK